MRQSRLCLLALGALLVLSCVACGKESSPTAFRATSTPPSGVTNSPEATEPTSSTAYPLPGYPAPGTPTSGTSQPYLPPDQTQEPVPYVPPEDTATRRATASRGATATGSTTRATSTILPTVEFTPTPTTDQAYPGPDGEDSTPTSGTPAYPGPEEGSPTPPGTTATSTPPSGQVTSTRTLRATPGPTSTPNLTPSPTEKPVRTEPPPPTRPAMTIIVWHSWNTSQVAVLSEVIYAFEQVYPQLKVELTYLPEADLRGRYEADVYFGRGPDLALAPAEWGSSFYEKGLVADLSGIADAGFLATINPACLEGARYRGALLGLPYRIRRGVLLYRNKTLIPNAPATYNELVTLARAATHGGKVGLYWDRGFLYSAAHLFGLGGRLEAENGSPAFNSPAGVEWLNFLKSYKDVGATTFNTDLDLKLFTAGRVGFLIDGSWNLETISNTLHAQNLAIDPWPAYGNTGHLSGFVEADNLYLNPNLTGDERFRALQLMGFFLAPEVQAILARRGYIPAVKDVPLDAVIQRTFPFLKAEMEAFEGGTPYPITPRLELYWQALERAMLAFFDGSLLPQAALQQAYDEVTR